MTAWQNRISSSADVDPNQLLTNPRNWRLHPDSQRDALAQVLDKVGWVQRVIVNRTTGFVVDGHLRVALAIQRGEKTIPVDYVELTEDEEALVLASLDWITGLAEADTEQMEALLAEIDGDETIASLLEDIAASAGVLPEVFDPDAFDPGEERYKEQYGVIVICEDEAHQEQIYNALLDQGYNCRVVVT